MESEAEMSTSSEELVLAEMVAPSRDANTDWLYSCMIFFLQTLKINSPDTYL